MVQIKFNVGTLNLNKFWALVSLNTSICAENNHLINSGEMAQSFKQTFLILYRPAQQKHKAKNWFNKMMAMSQIPKWILVSFLIQLVNV